MAGDEISDEQARNDAGSTSDSGGGGQGRSCAQVSAPAYSHGTSRRPGAPELKYSSAHGQPRTDPSPRCDRSWLTRRVGSGAIQPVPAGRLLTA